MDDRSPLPSPPSRPLLAGAYLATVAAVVALWWSVLTSPALIEAGDLLQPLSMDALRATFWPFWNRIFEFPNVETVDRLAWMAPFLLLPDPLLAQKLMIAAVAVGAALSMLVAARRLGSPLALAVLAAVIYAYNPWIANRLQHYFLLPGYAVLPLLLALWIRPPRRHAPQALALLLTLGATTPHYTVFLWALSGLWLLFRPGRAERRRFGATLAWFGLLNLYWIVPTLRFMARAELVPSLPTWETIETFSRRADPAAVARLQGYWWPLVDTDPGRIALLAGLGLVVAASLGLLVRPERSRLFLAGGALAFAVLAVGTELPALMGWLVIDGPLADRTGWLFRDPNKAVGPLAALLLLLAAGGVGKSLRRPGFARPLAFVQGGLLLAYLGFALTVAGPYLRQGFAAHAPPAAFEKANDWLEGREGRVMWVPHYFGTRALWNGDHATPEIAAYSSSLPVLAPYGYDGRSVIAFLALYFGGLLDDVAVDSAGVLRLWGTAWLVHHRDLPPYRLQPPGAFDNRVELLATGVEREGFEAAVTFPPLTVYRVGEPIGAFTASRVLASESPLGALFTISNFPGWQPDGWAFVPTLHPGVEGLALLPGDDPRMLLAEPSFDVDLAAAAPHYDPARTWSRIGEAGTDGWRRATLLGLPADPKRTLVLTRSSDARLEREVDIPAGRYRVLLRADQGRQAGAIRLQIGALDAAIDLGGDSARSSWLELGAVESDGRPLEVTLTNLNGLNTVSDLRLIPEAGWQRAEIAVADYHLNWMWPSSSLCRDLTASATEALDLSAGNEAEPLPLVRRDLGAAPWSAYDAVTFDLYGDGSSTAVEAWTEIRGVWIHLGSVRTWWQGWRRVQLPLTSSDFVFVADGDRNPADNLKLIVADGQAAPAGLQLRKLRLDTAARCSLALLAPDGGDAQLSLVGNGAPVEVEVAGRSYAVSDGVPTTVELAAGENRLELPLDAARRLRGVLLARGPLDFDVAGRRLPATSPAGVDVLCSDRWRLVVSPERFLAGVDARLAGAPLQGVPTDLLRLGSWVPPGSCGPLVLDNSWARLGRRSLGLSLLALLAALATVIVVETRARRGGARDAR